MQKVNRSIILNKLQKMFAAKMFDCDPENPMTI